MFVVDKMVLEDQINESNETPSLKLEEVQLPNGSTTQLGPSAKDTFSVFEDLCLLANSEKPRFLKLEFLYKTFALELIESVLTNYHGLFSKVHIVSLVFSILISYLAFRAHSSSTTTSLSATPEIFIRSASIPTIAALYACRISAHQAILPRIENRIRGVLNDANKNHQ